MIETASQTRLEKPARRQVQCPVCPVVFPQNRPHQRFCSTKCKNIYHGSMTPQVLRRDLDALREQVAELTRRVTVLDDPTAR